MNRDFVEMLSALSAEGAEYLIVGVYAMVAYGAPLFDLTADDLTRPDTVFQIGVPPGRIDLLSWHGGRRDRIRRPAREQARRGPSEGPRRHRVAALRTEPIVNPLSAR